MNRSNTIMVVLCIIVTCALLIGQFTFSRVATAQTVPGGAGVYQKYRVMYLSVSEDGASALQKELNQGSWKLHSFQATASGAAVAVLSR